MMMLEKIRQIQRRLRETAHLAWDIAQRERHGDREEFDKVDEASFESFPSSDPPSWIQTGGIAPRQENGTPTPP